MAKVTHDALITTSSLLSLLSEQARLTELTEKTEHAGRRKEVLELHNEVLE